jgi:hypothetical protein
MHTVALFHAVDLYFVISMDFYLLLTIKDVILCETKISSLRAVGLGMTLHEIHVYVVLHLCIMLLKL